LQLQRDRPGNVQRAGQVHGLRQLPAGEVRQPVVADLAGAHEPVERAQSLLQRRQRIKRMELIQIDRLQPQPAQRPVQCACQVPRRQPGAIRGFIQPEAALRGQDHLLGGRGRAAGEPVADDLLRHPIAVHVGRVNECPAHFDKTVKLPVRAQFVGLRAERHCP
jgi:hypothetical protein